MFDRITVLSKPVGPIPVRYQMSEGGGAEEAVKATGDSNPPVDGACTMTTATIENGVQNCKLNDDKSDASAASEAAVAAAPSEGGGDSPNKGALNKAFSDQFRAFSKFGDIKSDGKLLSLSQSDKWMKQAKVIDNKTITTTDTGIHFKKLKSLKVTEGDYKKFLCDLAKTKKMNVDDIKKKMVGCGTPGLTSSSVGGKTPSAVERLTDPSKYTGSHRQRFDETGKGRGIAGRRDMHDTSGYVSGYQNKNTYDKTHPTQ